MTPFNLGKVVTAVTIGANGNFYLDGVDSGVAAQGPAGPAGAAGQDGATPYIGSNGNWWIGTTDTGVDASGGQGFPTFIPSHVYSQYDMILVGQNLYAAKVAFTSGTAFAATDWILIPNSVGVGFPPFEANHAYSQFDVILVGSNLWVAEQAFTSGTAFDAADWILVMAPEATTLSEWPVFGNTLASTNTGTGPVWVSPPNWPGF